MAGQDQAKHLEDCSVAKSVSFFPFVSVEFCELSSPLL